MDISRVTENSYKEREGVLKVASQLNSYKYIFRETPNGDIGMDGQIEPKGVDGEPTGKLVAAQIKSGNPSISTKNSFSPYL